MHIILTKNDSSRYGRMYVLKSKPDPADAFQFFFADIRAHGVPSVMSALGQWRRVCRRGFTNTDMPKLSGVVGRGLGVVQQATHAACLEASRLFPGVQLPSTDRSCG